MNVEELLDLMEETLEAGTAVPFAAGKRVVDVDRMRDIIDEVRNNLPDEVRESKKIVNDREQILKNAHVESENIIQQAEERARALVSEQEIVKRSQQRAVEILTAAQTQAKELSRNATVYCEGILKNSEEVLARSVADIKNTRMNLRPAVPCATRKSKYRLDPIGHRKFCFETFRCLFFGYLSSKSAIICQKFSHFAQL